MVLFWICAAALAAGAAALIALRAASAARRAGEADPALAVYRRQLGETRDLVERGLLGAGELRAVEAEAGRRLLAQADRAPAAWRASPRSRAVVLAASSAAAALALAAYLSVGSPGAADQPFGTRLAQWRQDDPGKLAPDQMAAVLAALVRERPRDPTAHEYLGRAQLAAGDAASAAQSFGRAARLSPGSAALQAEVGEALALAADGKVTPDAEAAFGRALALQPGNGAARYFLGRAKAERGDAPGAVALWRPLAAELPASDPRRPALLAEMAQATGAPVAAAAPAGLDAGTAELARGMVARLAARLKDHPDDPEGWARLVRAYGVLGDRTGRGSALATARTLFTGRPQALAQIEAQGRAPLP